MLVGVAFEIEKPPRMAECHPQRFAFEMNDPPHSRMLYEGRV